MKKAVLKKIVWSLTLLFIAASPMIASAATTEKPDSLKTTTSKTLVTSNGETAEKVGASTCIACHEDQANLFKHSLHGRKTASKKGLSFEESCETCHGPGSLHAAAAGNREDPGFSTIKKLSALKGESANASCLACHKNGMQFNWKGSPHEMKNVACASCHKIHQEEAKANKSQLKEDESTLCFTCHVEKKGQMKRQAHMPVKEGAIQCSSCHNVHGTNNSKNLKGESITESCYKCHAEKRGPFLWDHPPVRENCLTCHDPHGSHHDKMLVAAQPYLCQRCHTMGSHPGTTYDTTTLVDRNQRMFAHACLNCHPKIHGSNHVSGNRFFR